jgi:hypothetical protein
VLSALGSAPSDAPPDNRSRLSAGIAVAESRERTVEARSESPGPRAGSAQDAPLRLDGGRFTVVAYPEDAQLARSLLASARRADTFPGLPRPRDRVLIALAPDRERFRQWLGPHAPEWGAAFAFPDSRRILMQGRSAGSDAGDPTRVLRHELAHLALHEALGDLPPRWFDEGYASYAAGEWGRDEVLATNLTLVLRRIPPLDSLDERFTQGATRAEGAYALAHRAVAELAMLDPERGLTLLFRYWRETGSLDRAVRSAYGITLSGFEERWRARTRRRYGGLALVADFSLAAALVSALLLPLYWRRRQRDRERMIALRAADEVAERAARESAIEELLRSVPPAGDATPPDAHPPAPRDRPGPSTPG